MIYLPELVKANQLRWDRAIPTRAFGSVAKRLCNAKDRYQAVSYKTGVPWYVIAVIHEREASQSWDANIAQGDPWNEISRHVPKGRGPFTSWSAAAYDALVNCAPYASNWKDWSPGGALALLEQYNGLGYATKSIPSPYIWSGTDQYVKGKYIADGVFDPNAVDQQLGCAGLLKAMMAIDPSVFAGTVVPAPPDVPPVKPPVLQPNLLQLIIQFILSLFKRH